MRPALAALQEQQQTIGHHQATIEQLVAYAQRQQRSIDYLSKGLQSLAQMAGVEQKVASAMLRTADTQNPAQPVPEPPAGPPTTTTQEAETPESMANVQTPGMAPGTTNDVAADATSTVYTPGADIPGPAFKNLVDVTTPVDGTQNPRPTEETRTLTDVRVGDPMNPETAYPLRGDFQNAQRLGSQQNGQQQEEPQRKTASQQAAADASLRTIASLRLARLRIEAGTAEGDSDFTVAAGIEKDASVSTHDIEHEISTLEGVKREASARRTAGKGNLVPRSASRRPQPSMQGTAHTGTAHTASSDSDDSDLFD